MAKSSRVYALVMIGIIMLLVVCGAHTSKEPLIRSLDFGQDDAELLMKIAQAEAGSGSTETKAMIMLVVLNRAWHPAFPNSVEEVITSSEFRSVASGEFDDAEPDINCEFAIDWIYKGWNESENALYFVRDTGMFSSLFGRTYIKRCEGFKFYR